VVNIELFGGVPIISAFVKRGPMVDGVRAISSVISDSFSTTWESGMSARDIVLGLSFGVLVDNSSVKGGNDSMVVAGPWGSLLLTAILSNEEHDDEETFTRTGSDVVFCSVVFCSVVVENVLAMVYLSYL
jgi:hypothetical protein